MQELKDKYKDDPTRMNQELMKLYKQYGINPVGGLSAMMIQIPIFSGLFKMLGQAVELRNGKISLGKGSSNRTRLRNCRCWAADQYHSALHAATQVG